LGIKRRTLSSPNMGAPNLLCEKSKFSACILRTHIL
jgi:hypothetical protein